MNISIFDQIKDLLTCPITLKIIKEHIATSDGFTYEQTAIQKWMCHNPPSSSMTKEPIVFKELREPFSYKNSVAKLPCRT